MNAKLFSIARPGEGARCGQTTYAQCKRIEENIQESKREAHSVNKISPPACPPAARAVDYAYGAGALHERPIAKSLDLGVWAPRTMSERHGPHPLSIGMSGTVWAEVRWGSNTTFARAHAARKTGHDGAIVVVFRAYVCYEVTANNNKWINLMNK